MNFLDTATGRVLWKKLFLKILQYLQESCTPATLLKTDSITRVFLWILHIFKDTNFEEHLLTAASDFLKQLENTGEIFINRLGTIKLLTIQSEFINVCFYGRRCGKKYGFCKHFLIFCKQFSIFCKHFSISCKHFSIYCDQI